ncbi:hypothetical protein C2W64_01442 [Brevibacillus laterosporus]|nr:hypothetical protein C2W64_01442 [Brevibacillus laterosporus]
MCRAIGIGLPYKKTLFSHMLKEGGTHLPSFLYAFFLLSLIMDK